MLYENMYSILLLFPAKSYTIIGLISISIIKPFVPVQENEKLIIVYSQLSTNMKYFFFYDLLKEKLRLLTLTG